MSMKNRIIFGTIVVAGIIGITLLGLKWDKDNKTVPSDRTTEYLLAETEPVAETEPLETILEGTVSRNEFYKNHSMTCVETTTEEETTTEDPTTETTTMEDPTTEEPTTQISLPDVPLSHELLVGIHDIATRYHIEQDLILAVIKVESRFIGKVGDNGNSVGLMQIQPKWWQSVAESYGLNIYTDLGNVEMGVIILKSHINKYGDLTKALQVYNTGNPEGNEYANKVYSALNEIRGCY